MSPVRPTIVLVDRDNTATARLIAFLRARGMNVLWAADGDRARRLLLRTRPDAVLVARRAPRIDGVALSRFARDCHPGTWVMLAGVAGDGSAAPTPAADEILPRPIPTDRLMAGLERGLARERLAARVAELERRLEPQPGVAPFAGRSRAISRVLEQLHHLASTDAPVLIVGEAGTGKRLAAQVIHHQGPRRHQPLIIIDCGALEEPQLEQALFGEDGEPPVPGRLEQAEGGALLLDGVDELPSGLQTRLLRVLQSRAFERSGGGETLKADVRLIATTTRDLAAQVRAGAFREDLLQRLGTATILMPPLRDRREDIPALVEQLLAESRPGRGRRIKGVTRGVLDRLMEHAWPGNVHELRLTIESMAMVARRGRALDLADLPAALRPQVGEPARLAFSVGMTVDEVERELIAATLAHTGHDKRRAAALLGMGLRTLYRKIEAYRLG